MSCPDLGGSMDWLAGWECHQVCAFGIFRDGRGDTEGVPVRVVRARVGCE